jgi:hypothetical protein
MQLVFPKKRLHAGLPVSRVSIDTNERSIGVILKALRCCDKIRKLDSTSLNMLNTSEQ